MRFFWELMFSVFQKLAFKCACKLEEFDIRKSNRIDELLEQPKLTAKQAKELDSLLGKDNEVIVR